MTCERGIEAGAFALCALDEQEYRAYGAHLVHCDHCRREVDQLRNIVDALPMTAPQVVVPPDLKARIMHTVETEARLLRAAGPDADRPPVARAAGPRRRFGLSALTLRPAVAAACASLLVAAGAISGLVLLGGDSTPSTTTLDGVVARSGVKAQVRLTGGHASLHVVNLPSPPSGMVYQVWLKNGTADPVPTHTLFNVREDGRATVAIEERVRGYDTVLVTAEPSGGSETPSGAPVITARLT